MFGLAFLLLWAVGSALPFGADESNDAAPSTFSVHGVYNKGYTRNGPAEYLRACRKWGIALPDHFDRLATGSAAAENQTSDREYLSPVDIGTPGQTILVDIDTGSADL